MGLESLEMITLKKNYSDNKIQKIVKSVNQIINKSNHQILYSKETKENNN